MNRLNNCIAVLIPSYDRPDILKFTLPSWLRADCVSRVFVVAEASSQDKLEMYKDAIESFEKSGRLICKLAMTRIGSVRARNTLLDLFTEDTCEYAVMADDDYLLLNEGGLLRMARALQSNDKIGAVGGKVIVVKRRADPDFFLNLPLNLADLMTRLTGYVFLDIKHGPRYSEFLPPFFMFRKEVMSKMIKYDEVFDTPTGFREESDFQQQIKLLGYRLLYDPRAYVIHLAIEGGGNRPKMVIGKRMYWKIRNHTVFVFKWNNSITERIWYLTSASLLLSMYRPWHFIQVLKGLRDGLHAFKKISAK
ncbi:glycosyltransferase family 2 protein [Candidatus Bathyarchaeota archaeon]|nr:glycosyltransferase family 2 protein [Candidatus Bathyarchaeota archaeon]